MTKTDSEQPSVAGTFGRCCVFRNSKGRLCKPTEALSCIETDNRLGKGEPVASGAHPGRLSCRGLAPTLGQGLVVLLLGGVQVVHVGRVVLAVVQLHDLRVDVRLQRAIVVRQVGEAVLVPGARGTGRRGQPPARAERDTGLRVTPPTARTSHARHPEIPPTEDAAAPGPAAHLHTARHNILKRPRPPISTEHSRSLSSASPLCGVRTASTRTARGGDPAGRAHPRRGGRRRERPHRD